MKRHILWPSYLFVFVCFVFFFPGYALCQEPPAKDPVGTLLQDIVEFKEKGRYDSALVSIEQVFHILDPYNPSQAESLIGIDIAYERAMLYGMFQDHSRSEEYFLELYEFLEKTGKRDTLLAEVLHGIGSQQYSLGKYNDAKDYLERALDRKMSIFTETHSSVASTYNALGNLASDLGNLPLARTYYQKTLDIRKEVLPEDHSHIADTYHNLGLLAYQEENFEKAIQLIKQGFEIEKRIYPPEHPMIADGYNNLGVLYDVMNNTPRALECYKESLEIRRKILGEKHPAVAQSYHNLGVAFQQIGDNRKALANLFQSLYIFREVDEEGHSEEIAKNLENIGAIQYQIGQLQEAEKNFEEALNLFLEIFPPNHPSIGGTLHSLGEIQREFGNYPGAQSYFKRAQSIYNSLSHTPTSLARLYKDQAMVHVREGNWEEANSVFDKGDKLNVELLGKDNVERVNLLNEKAHSYTLQNNRKASKDIYQEAIRINLANFSPESSYQVPFLTSSPIRIPTYLTSLHQKALLHAEEESPKEWEIALQLWEIAIHWLGRLQTQSTYRASKLALRSKARDMCEASIKTHMRLYEKTGKQAYLEGAYQLAEYSQTALLHEWIQEVEAQQQAGVPNEWIEEVQDYNATHSYYKKKLYETSHSSSEDSLKAIFYQTRMFEVKNSLDSLVEEIEKHYPSYYEIKYSPKPFELQRVKQRLTPSEQIIRYFLTEEKLYLFSIRKNELSFKRLDIDSTFLKMGIKFYEFVQRSPTQYLQKDQDVQSYLISGYQLYKQLIEPIVDEKTEKLYLIPDGMLNYLSFEALLTEPVEEFLSYSDLPYVLKSYQISYAYSSRLLFSQGNSQVSTSFLGFAPDYGDQFSQKVSTRFVDSLDLERLPPLMYNQSEVESLQTLMRGKAFLGKEAREEIFKQKAPEADILHLAMHALADDHNPLYSGLVFSQVDSLFEDNFLYTYELFNMRLRANLAVLSACNTGIGKIQKGEGMLSLARGFQYAGCPNLIMSLWQTDDKVAYQVMQNFYSELKAGNSYAEALHEAKLAYLNTQDRTHPFYWSTFLYVGQRSHPPKLPLFWWIVGIVGIIGTMGIFLRKNVKKKW